MRKEKMITRTITSTHAQVMAFNLDANELVSLDVTYVGDLSDLEIEKKFNIDYDNSAKFLKIVSAEKIEKLYGISERDFLEYAVELDSDTRKPVEKVEG